MNALRNMKNNYTVEQTQDIISLITQGYPTREISTQTGRTEASIDTFKSAWRAYHKNPKPQVYSYRSFYKRFALIENE